MITKITGKLFTEFSDLVYQETGINLTENKVELLNARVAKRLRYYDIEPAAYLDMVMTDSVERMIFLDIISTNHTFFFREANTLKYIDDCCEKIWCAASSSGEEPYTIAMYCHERGLSPVIEASDISDSCLHKARIGIYPEKNTARVPLNTLSSYFKKGIGDWEGYLRIKDEIKKRVNFYKFNLIKDPPMSSDWDIIFCRNVMIYFDNDIKTMVIQKLERALKRKGYLIVGGSESLNGIDHSLSYVEPSVYQKI